MAVEIIYTVEDASGDQGSTQVRVAGLPTIAQLNGFGAGWATALNNMIAGKIIGAVARLLVSLASLTSNLVSANSDVEHVGKFEFLTVSGNRVKVNIPALSEVAIGATTSDALNQAQADVAAFISAMELGVAVVGGVIEPCDIGEDDISDVVFSREAFRNSGARR